MMSPLDPFLDAKDVVVLDGALATELERRGADLNDPLWSAKLLVEDPGRIEEVHADYYRAGADVGTSASYQASFEGFARRGLSRSETTRLFALSVSLVQRARDRFWASQHRPSRRLRPLVAASLGCYGAVLHDGSEYRGDYDLSRDELVDFHRPRLEALVRAEPDLVAFETIPCASEAEALVRLLEEFPEVPAWVGFSCRDERRVSHGELLSECVAVVSASPSVVACGVNCTPPRFVSGLLREAGAATRKPLLAYPNSGEAWDAAEGRWLPGASGPAIGDGAREWRALGARLIGGCCRTGPDAIEALARTFGARQPNRL